MHTHYKAVNVLGLVAAADMEKSIATVHYVFWRIHPLHDQHESDYSQYQASRYTPVIYLNG